MVTAKSSSVVPRTSAAPQEVAANKFRTTSAATMAMPSRPAGFVRRRLFRHGDRRALGQQIIRSIRRGTLMRHVIFAHPVTTCPHRMIDAAATARLVTATGFALRASAGFPGTVCAAIHLAAIAMAADEHLHATGQAQNQSSTPGV